MPDNQDAKNPALNARTTKIWVALALTFFLLMKLFLNLKQIPDDFMVSNIPFQFGAYASSLLDRGEYADCSSIPCKYASRMPLIPWTLAALGHISRSAKSIAIIKNVAFSVLTLVVFLWIVNVHRKIFPGSAVAWFLLLPLALAPPLARHASSIFYEEGFLVEFLVCWTLLFLIGVLFWGKKEKIDGTPAVTACLAFGTLIYLTKDTMLLVLLASLALGILWTARFHEARTLAAVLISLAAVLAWGAHNKIASGRFSISTSWDGENLYRGFNQQSYDIYPYINLDEVLHPPQTVTLVNGESFTVGHREIKFENEWEWNDYFEQLSYSWLESNHQEAFNFALMKIYNFFLSVYLNPYENGLNYTYANFIHFWLIFGRMMQLELAVLLAALWRRKNSYAKALVAGVVVVNLTYATPYLLCFNYERHITVYLALVAACSFMVCSALLSPAEAVGDGPR
ncbi:MAG TPA: hypothetical protein VK914_13255 [bacterium]|jgi:hypothetical protein|nr:hypothetical protein [bacterium]